MSDWDNIWAGAQARADQNMALIRDQAEAYRAFMQACMEFDEVLKGAGMRHAARTSALVNTALAAGLTSE
jgi:hypothetical protein